MWTLFHREKLVQGSTLLLRDKITDPWGNTKKTLFQREKLTQWDGEDNCQWYNRKNTNDMIDKVMQYYWK